MFKAYKPPDESLDWTETLTQKIIPLGGAIAGGIIGAKLGGPAGAMAGSQSGFGSGKAIGGLFDKSKDSTNRFDMGTAIGISGGSQLVDAYNQQKKYTGGQVNMTGQDPMRPTTGAANPAPTNTQYTMPAQAAPVGVPDDNRKWKWGPPE